MANPLTQQLEAAWADFREAIDDAGPEALERPASSGWTAKEMLGHIAFWDECVEPVVIGILRGDVAAMVGWRFGSGYVPDDDADWPHEDVHNAREGGWAKSVPLADVIARLDAAHLGAVAAIETFTEDELADEKFRDYVIRQAAHYNDHRAELEEGSSRAR